jgi:hypothetical protein
LALLKGEIVVKASGHHSWSVGDLPVGCQHCVQGTKTVVFLTGVCPRHCAYCPISDYKKDNDVIFANEAEIHNEDDLAKIFREAESHESTGAGFTGGDPLARLERTIRYIKALKERFGPGYHIHLYTSLVLATPTTLQHLRSAGLDEIRFHPDIERPEDWENIKDTKKYGWDVGIEIPVIPKKEQETKNMLTVCAPHVNFVVLNELEYSDGSSFKLPVQCKAGSYAAKGSVPMAKRLMTFLEQYCINVHLCTARLKDRVQLTNRMKKKTGHVQGPCITKEGTVLRGAVYHKDHSPRTLSMRQVARVPKGALHDMYEQLKLVDAAYLDTRHGRVLVHPSVLAEAKKRYPEHEYALVEEYPTDDALPVEIHFL